MKVNSGKIIEESGKTCVSYAFHFPLFVLLLLALLAGCKHNNEQRQPPLSAVDYTQVEVAPFSADSALAFVKGQLAFGNRIPGTPAWQRCGDWIAARMRQWCDTVVVQRFNATLWDGKSVPGTNIIASLRPQAAQRVILATHWDSRSWADHDPATDRQHQPVPGANDGASGAALLMEMARTMSQMPPKVGVDFIFFDVEDQGAPEWSEVYDADTWCKGSQHWSRNPHVPFYRAVYGILFDMVGTLSPRFTKEHVSMYYAPGLTNKLWNAAAALGYGSIFVNQETDDILDDHYYVNRLAGIPMTDIVQNSGNISFFEHWHTTTDDLNAVSPESLRTVATVAMKVIYADYPRNK